MCRYQAINNHHDASKVTLCDGFVFAQHPVFSITYEVIHDVNRLISAPDISICLLFHVVPLLPRMPSGLSELWNVQCQQLLLHLPDWLGPGRLLT